MAVASHHRGEVYLSGSTDHLRHHRWALLCISDIGGAHGESDACSPCHDAARVTLTGRCDECW